MCSLHTPILEASLWFAIQGIAYVVLQAKPASVWAAGCSILGNTTPTKAARCMPRPLQKGRHIETTLNRRLAAASARLRTPLWKAIDVAQGECTPFNERSTQQIAQLLDTFTEFVTHLGGSPIMAFAPPDRKFDTD